MRSQLMRAAWAFSTFSSCLAAPSALVERQTSCPAEDLTADTWTSLNIDSFLSAWSAVNVTFTSEDNVQSLANSFGAPNFFCGLDDFCNAGQPCLPVTLPAWYVMVAVQNWNSYMNSLNTALNFASTMVSLTLPGIVSDFYDDPDDNTTPLQQMGKVFSGVLSLVPFTGPLKAASSAVSGGISFLNSVVKPPAQENEFLQWSSVSTSMATILESYQGAISTAITTTLNAQVNSSTGINSLLTGGAFLGVSQNFTETDIQAALINSTNVLAISLALQAQKVFLAVGVYPGLDCDGTTGYGLSVLCVPGTNDYPYVIIYTLTKNDGHDGMADLDGVADLLVNKYGISQQQFMSGLYGCWNGNGGQQLTDNFNGFLPLDSTSPCLFNILVCNTTSNAEYIGYISDCKNQGVPV